MLLSTNMIRLHDTFGIRGTFEVMAKAGFAAMDFNTDVAEYYNGTHDAAFYRELGDYARSCGIEIGQAHAPFPSSYPDDEGRTEARFSEIVCGMENAAALGAPMIVVHPCTHIDYKIEENREAAFEYNLAFYRRLIPYAENLGIKIAIENIGKNNVTSTPERLNRLIDALDDPVFTVCFDVGHSMLAGIDPAEGIRELGPRLVNGCTHIHDNCGTSDDHTLPFYGVIEWEPIVRALADIGYLGNLNYEAAHFLRRVPKELYEDGLCYMGKVGQYLVDKFCEFSK